MPTSNNPKRQKGGEENSTPSTTASATRAEEEDEDIITTTTQRINRTFDEAKENTRRAVQEAERELPRYMQIVTTNQEQSVGAVRDTIENYLDSQREVTNFIQSFWKSYIDNVLWTPTRKAIENYAASVSNTTDATVAGFTIT
jgi:F0F1-type ATP synthase membrane subunit b/b'